MRLNPPKGVVRKARGKSGDKEDGRKLAGSQPPATPGQFRLQGFLLHGLCSGTAGTGKGGKMGRLARLVD